MRSRSNEPAPPFDFPELLFWIARALVYALILFVPWPYGMVEWSWQAWLVPVACLILLLTACGALMRGMNHAQRLIWPLMVILIVSVIQTVPLPKPLWRVLSQTADFENKVEVLAAEFAVDRDGPRDHFQFRTDVLRRYCTFKNHQHPPTPNPGDWMRFCCWRSHTDLGQPAIS